MRYFTFFLTLALFPQLMAQSPEAFNYQAVARDASGDAITNTAVGVQFQVHQTTAGGTVVYTESHTPTTNDHGLFSVEVGNGTPTVGTFPAIDWSVGPYFLEVGLDPAGGSSYASMGTQQLLSVPYALFANSGKKITDADGNTQIQVEESPNEDVIRFDTQGAERMVINSSGNVGIGTSSPTEAIELFKSVNGRLGLEINNPNVGSDAHGVLWFSNDVGDGRGYVGLFSSATTDPDYQNRFMITGRNGNDLLLGAHGSANVVFATGFEAVGVQEKMRLTNIGDLGIGTTAPQNRLDVRNSIGLSISNTQTVGRLYQSVNDGYLELYTGEATPISRVKLSSVGDSYIAPALNGNLGIGTLSPGAKLEVAGQVKITGGTPGLNKVLTSDASGLATWETPVIGVDNLGDHSATQNIQLNGNFLSGDGGAEGIYIDGDGDIGIGTNSPSPGTTIHVKDDEAYLILEDNAGYTPGWATGLGGSLERFVRFTANTTTDDLRYGVEASGHGNQFLGSMQIIQTVGSTPPQGEMAFFTTPSGNSGAGERLRIDANGNVGIGTTTPTAKLEVAGATLNDGSNALNVNGAMPVSPTATNALVSLTMTPNSSTTQQQRGLDISIPDAAMAVNGVTNALHVENAARATTGTSNVGMQVVIPDRGTGIGNGYGIIVSVQNSLAGNPGRGGVISSVTGINSSTNPVSSGNFSITGGGSGSGLVALIANNGPSTGDIFRGDDNGSTAFVIKDGGNVGIGTTTPNVALDVIGDIEYTGTITDVSDRRLKENFEIIENPLERLNALNGLTYNMKGDSLIIREYGVIAQEVQKIFPELVSVVDEENGYLGVSYIQLIPVLLEAIKELNEENEAQKELIEANAEAIQDLRSTLTAQSKR